MTIAGVICFHPPWGWLYRMLTRIVAGEGVERTWPIHSPRIVKIKVLRAGKVRRSKLYYLRDRVGKATRIKESIEETVRINREAKEEAKRDALAAAEAKANEPEKKDTGKKKKKKK